MRDLVDQLVAMADRRSWSIDGNDEAFCVRIAEAQIAFDRGCQDVELAFERLAEAIEATIAVERARGMVQAAAMASHPVPLWLVSGPTVLASWLHWAGTRNALRKVLNMTDAVGLAPVAGYLDRRARRELGQGGVRIRVRGGMAVAERIQLSDRPRCVATIGERAFIRIEDHRLPDTLIAGLQPGAASNARRKLAEVVSHPFFAAADLAIAGIVQEGAALVFEVYHHWTPLEPVPEAARSVLPPDADPVFPWRATAGERRRLEGLVEEARHRVAAMRGPR